ncbi:hypothetical protein INR49_018928 [Caranx melampygus]|nr:hypothetical protein INR49_018928 [Caranx melampygus]
MGDGQLLVDTFGSPVLLPQRAPGLPVDDNQPRRGIPGDVVIYLTLGLGQMLRQVAILRDPALVELTPDGVNHGIEAEAVLVEDGEELTGVLAETDVKDWKHLTADRQETQEVAAPDHEREDTHPRCRQIQVAPDDESRSSECGALADGVDQVGRSYSFEVSEATRSASLTLCWEKCRLLMLLVWLFLMATEGKSAVLLFHSHSSSSFLSLSSRGRSPVEVETPEGIGAKTRPQLNSPLHEGLGTFLKPPACQLLDLRRRHVHIRLGGQFLRLLSVNVFLVPVSTPLRPPELPVDDSQAAEVLCGDEVVDVLVGFEQAAVHGHALVVVVRVVSQPVGVEDGDILSSPISTRAPVDVEQAVGVDGDLVLDGTQVHRGVPCCNEGFPANQGQFGGFLTKGSVEEQEQPGTGEGHRYDVLGGGCPTHWHCRHPGVQEEQLSIILKEQEKGKK